MPSSRAERRAKSNASSSVTWIAPSMASVCRFFGMKPAPMPWMGCGPGAPPLMTGDLTGSTANTFSFGQRFFSTSPHAVMWPPVPTPVMR